MIKINRYTTIPINENDTLPPIYEELHIYTSMTINVENKLPMYEDINN